MISNGVLAGPGEWLTQRFNNARTGWNDGELALTQANVGRLSLVDRWVVDGEIYAQVLVAEQVPTRLVPRNLAIVATTESSVYAFDLDAPPGAAPVWHTGAQHELGTPAFSARNVGGNNGILATPVIDKEHARLFVVARDCDPAFPSVAPSCKQRLFTLDLHSGAVLDSVEITGSVFMAPSASSSVTRVEFDPNHHWSRPGLALASNRIYVSFGSGPAGDQHEEDFVYHGWVFRFDANDIKAQPDIYCSTPRGRGGSVWMAGAAPALDDDGVYFVGANGIMDYRVHPPADWVTQPLGQEDSVVRLPQATRFPTPDEPLTQFADTRAYRPEGNVFQFMESGDNGFGSSGPLLIPGSDALLVGTKAGLVYLLDKHSLQALQPPLSPFKSLPLQPGHTLYLHSWWGIPVITQAMPFFRAAGAGQGTAFAWASEDKLAAFTYDYAAKTLTLRQTADVPALPGGAGLVVSSNGGSAGTAVLWATTRSVSGAIPAGHLWAFDPATLTPLYRGDTPAWSKFTPPTVVRGRVLVPSTSNVTSVPKQVLVYAVPANADN